MPKFLKHPLFLFLLKAVGLYLLWLFLYERWLHPQGTADLFVIDQIVWLSGNILEFVGFELSGANPLLGGIRTLGIGGSDGVWIGDPCNGLTLFGLFTGFVLAFPGPWRTKLWYIPAGIILIHLANVVRVIGLVVIERFYPESLDFNHTYTFTILVYSLVFILWYTWAKKFSGLEA